MPPATDPPEWERMQIKTFTRWANAYLRQSGMTVDDLSTDFQDGEKLIALYESITGNSLGRHTNNPRQRIQKIENINQVTTKINEFVESAGIKLQFSPEAICDGDMRAILGMVWCMIHKFSIQYLFSSLEESTGTKNPVEFLMGWCQELAEGLESGDGDPIQVTNFSTSWQDGLAFCSVIHGIDPKLVDLKKLKKTNREENLELAFSTAEEKLGIPRLLDVEDMLISKPDDKSILTYIAQFRKFHVEKTKKEEEEKLNAKDVEQGSGTSCCCCACSIL